MSRFSDEQVANALIKTMYDALLNAYELCDLRESTRNKSYKSVNDEVKDALASAKNYLGYKQA